jgi:hypothetical protein
MERKKVRKISQILERSRKFCGPEKNWKIKKSLFEFLFGKNCGLVSIVEKVRKY